MFRAFWQLGCADAGSFFFRVRLTSLTKVKERLRWHFGNVLTWFKNAITNAVSEGLNSKTQIVKAEARGFRCFESWIMT